MTDAGNPWATPAAREPGTQPAGRDPRSPPSVDRASDAASLGFPAPTRRRWWSKPSTLLAAGHTTAILAWSSVVCLLLAYSLAKGVERGGEEGVASFIFFIFIGLPALALGLGLGAVAVGLLFAAVGPLTLAWLAESQPARPATLVALGHAVVACATPVVLLGVAFIHGL